MPRQVIRAFVERVALVFDDIVVDHATILPTNVA
jgi:hypothetical protein